MVVVLYPLFYRGVVFPSLHGVVSSFGVVLRSTLLLCVVLRPLIRSAVLHSFLFSGAVVLLSPPFLVVNFLTFPHFEN